MGLTRNELLDFYRSSLSKVGKEKYRLRAVEKGIEQKDILKQLRRLRFIVKQHDAENKEWGIK